MSKFPNNLDDLFKDLDANEFNFFAISLAAYRDSLTSKGFTRKEAMRLVETYSKFIYDMSVEEFIAQKEDELMKDIDEDDDPTV